MQITQGIIIKGLGGLYTVACDGRLFSCPARGIFRKEGIKPMIGDKVTLDEIDEKDMTAVISEILPRKNQLIRPAVANVDHIVVVIATCSPAPDLLLVDKLIMSAEQKHIPVTMAVNKTDQDPEAAAKFCEEYRNAVSNVVETCTTEGTGTEKLKEIMHGKISVMVGQSGAGKSSLINLLLGESVMETGGLSKKTDRGRHTTRHNEMFISDNGFVIDSPGFSLFELEETEPLQLQNLYPEIYNNRGECFFQDCSHTGEPKCFVKELLENKTFSQGRFERYRILYKELVEKEKNKYK